MHSPKQEVISTLAEDVINHLSVYTDEIQYEIACLIYFYVCMNIKKVTHAEKEVKSYGQPINLCRESKKGNGKM